MLGQRLRQIILTKQELLKMIKETESEKSPAPGKWSFKQIMGHLIDSASNNHQRFVRAQLKNDLIFQGYKQDRWVEIQNYQNSKWDDLIELWSLFNLHLAKMIDSIPEEVLNQPRHQHNLHQIAWKTIPPEQPTTLKYFIEDYIGHLENHLRQIL